MGSASDWPCSVPVHRLASTRHRTAHCNGLLVIGIAYQVGGYGWLRPVDAVLDRQSNEHNATAHPIERSPPKTPHRFEHRVRDLADDLG